MSAAPCAHVSAALKHLRLGVSAAAVCCALALLAQLLLFAFAHFTDVHRETLEATGSMGATPTVLEPRKPATPSGSPEAESASAEPAEPDLDPTKPRPEDPPPPTAEQIARALADAERARGPTMLTQATLEEIGRFGPVNARPAGPLDLDAAALALARRSAVNTVATDEGLALSRAAGVIQMVGVFAALVLVFTTFQATVIAGGGRVPGVEMAVTAGTWALVILLLAIPWRGVLPDLRYPGVFQSYETLLVMSLGMRSGASWAPGAGAFYLMNVGLPLLMLAGLAAVVLRFRAGIERGVIVTHASMLDEKLEKEIRGRKLGELSTPRAVGALNRAMGLGGTDADVAEEAEPSAATPVAEPEQARPMGGPRDAAASPHPRGPMGVRPGATDPNAGGFGPRRPI